ncbi:MarC family protein [Vulgatibacter sp.]|uniref:MarC family protein n=1 Tax=Vulgatibacter sp. TaxID=1971226 RepID=UPI0035643241
MDAVAIGQMLSFTVVAISALFFVVDPIGLVPIFVTMTAGDSPAKKRATAKKACLIFVGVVGAFAIAGGLIFQLLGVTLAAFKIAGGILLLLTALDMLQSKQSDTRTSGEEIGEAKSKEDVAVVPLAMPLLAGPGAIATVMVLAARAESPVYLVPVLLSVLVTAVATYLLLRAADLVDRWLGISGRAILERVMGLLLAAIAVQFVLGGVRDAFPEIFDGGNEAALVAPVEGAG